MRPEDQVCSLELSKQLKELGVKQESYFDWYSVKGGREKDCYPSHDDGGYGFKICSAFTVAELGEMLPVDAFTYKDKDIPWCALFTSEDKRLIHRERSITEADARSKLLIYLIKNKLIDGVKP